MIVDTSAIIAILRDEPERETMIDALLDSPTPPSMSSAAFLETLIVAKDNARFKPAEQLDRLIEDHDIAVAPFTALQARIAGEAYRRYGKGSGHSARLNFGDCMTYALAKDTRQTLLFKGEDFGKTDIKPAL